MPSFENQVEPLAFELVQHACLVLLDHLSSMLPFIKERKKNDVCFNQRGVQEN
jgi:hypothetical protein